jgi:hypothetical protein
MTRAYRQPQSDRILGPRRLRREIAIGLAIALLGLVLSAFALEAGGSRPADDATNRQPSTPATTLTGTVRPALFPSGALSVP